MNPTPIEIAIQTVSLGEEKQRIVDTIVLAFSCDPAARWLYQEAAAFSHGFPQFVRAFGGQAFEEGTAHSTTDFRAAALWFAPGIHGNEEQVIHVLETTVDKSRLVEAFDLFEQMDAFHPTEPHWYLPLIGADPAYQGNGLGSALLRHALEECDRSGTKAYLESSNAANITLYQRHGFHVEGEIRSGTSPVIYPMTRDPQYKERGILAPREEGRLLK